MDTQPLLAWVDRYQGPLRAVAVPVLACLVAAVYVLVYMTGGIKFVYSHTMYIPILLSGLVFGAGGGLFVAILGGLVLGPLMPLVVATGEPQEPLNWLYRTGVFAMIGFLSGAASDAAKAHVANLKWLSRHDPSTGLPNRSALFDALARLAQAKQGAGFTLVAVSIANRMELKSAFGFAVVEEAVRQLADRFARRGGQVQVFHTDSAQVAVLLLPDGKDKDSLVDELVEACHEPIVFEGVPIHVDGRMGEVSADRVVAAPETYLQRAEAALTVAYEREQECVNFNPAIVTTTEGNLSILGELNDAIRTRQLSLHYQPKVGIATPGVHGVEALIRWTHPVRGEIPPGAFIPRAEQSTLIQSIARFALDEAMRQMVAWRREGIDTSVAVNVSPQNLVYPGFTELVLDLLERHGVSGDRLELEITERALMADMDHTIGELARLAGAKLVISIDDFGTGYSSLQYLHRLPISLIKIDRSFVQRLPGDSGAAYIVDAAVALAHKMGMKALAEGVEDPRAFAFLGDIGCDIAQGFMIAPPLPAADFVQWHEQYRNAGGKDFAAGAPAS